MDIEKQKQAFEVWAKKEGFNITRFGNRFDMPSTNYAWMAWKAGIASVVVNLPASYKYDGGFNYMDKEAVEESLTSAGIKYE